MPFESVPLIPKIGRRSLLQICAAEVTGPFLVGFGSLLPMRVQAANPRAAFEATDWRKVLEQLGASQAQASHSVLIEAPDIAENGAYVPISISSELANTTRISIIVERNPAPLVTTIRLGLGAEGFVTTQIKMSESSRIRAVILADGKFYTAVREVVVINGGCG